MLGLGVLCVFPAPTYYLWFAALLVTELGVYFILACLLILGFNLFVGDRHLVSTVTSVIALILVCIPIIQAYIVIHRLDSELISKFKPTNQNFSLNVGKLFQLKMDKNPPHTQIAYLNGLKANYYQAKATGLRPCVIVIHGGSWSSGDNNQVPELNGILADAGYQVFAINYRLAPQHHFPAPVDDVNATISYIKSHSNDFQADTNKIILLGRSAGGQIALTTAYASVNHNIAAVVAYYSPTDMEWDYQFPTSKWVMDSRKIMENYFGGTIQQVKQNYLAGSPILQVNKVTPPTLFIHGKNDILVAHQNSVRLQKVLDANQVNNYILSLPWATHGCDFNVNGPSGQISSQTVLYFLDRVI